MKFDKDDCLDVLFWNNSTSKMSLEYGQVIGPKYFKRNRLDVFDED